LQVIIPQFGETHTDSIRQPHSQLAMMQECGKTASKGADRNSGYKRDQTGTAASGMSERVR